jgi:hypothetical protein
MMLFICHASEDRGFVRPLAEALRKEYEKVWYEQKMDQTAANVANEAKKPEDD